MSCTQAVLLFIPVFIGCHGEPTPTAPIKPAFKITFDVVIGAPSAGACQYTMSALANDSTVAVSYALKLRAQPGGSQQDFGSGVFFGKLTKQWTQGGDPDLNATFSTAAGYFASWNGGGICG